MTVEAVLNVFKIRLKSVSADGTGKNLNNSFYVTSRLHYIRFHMF